MAIQYKDYYKLLGVDKSASEKEIKSAFRKLAKETHPDRNNGDDSKFKEINEAYEVLGDAEKRQRYDTLGANYRHGSSFDPQDFGGFGGMGGAGFGGGSGFSDFFDVLFGQMGGMQGGGVHFGGADPFGGMGGFGGGRAQQRQEIPDLNVQQTLEITMEDLFSDSAKSVYLAHSGKTLQVKLPKGIRSGGKMKLSGEGHTYGSHKGNVVLTIQIKPHPVYQLDDNNLIYEATIPVPDLILGTEIKVPTLSGAVNMKIPERTEPGKRLRLKGKGLPGKAGTPNGDLMVKIKACFPEILTPEIKSLYQQLQELEAGKD